MTDPEGLRILVVDDNRSAAEAAAMLLERDGHTVSVCFSGEEAITRLGRGGLDLVVTDLRMEPVDGLAVVRAARAATPGVDAIVMTAYGSVEAAVEAMQLGAVDFLTKPVTADQLLQRVRDYRRVSGTPPALIGESAPWKTLVDQLMRLASVPSSVLLVGETGTGRRHLGRWLHHNGPEAALPLVRLQPGRATDPTLLAQAGTLLLTGIETWPMVAQRTVLRELEALEPGRPPRLIATASPQVQDAVSAGAVVPELYFRLAVLPLRLPPLRERPEDIPSLLDHFLHASSRMLDRARPDLAAGQVAALQQHSWPGNVRELANLAERCCVLGPSVLEVPSTGAPAEAPGPLTEGFQLSNHLESVERRLLERALEQTGGDRPAMSRLLGLERNTLRYKLNKYGLLDRS